MEESPILMLWLCIWSTCFGGMLGLLNDLNHALRFFFGLDRGGAVAERILKHPIPIRKRPIRRPRTTPLLAGIRQATVFFQDIAFFLVSGSGIVVLNFTYNDGKNRIYTVLGLGVGFLLYRALLRRGARASLEAFVSVILVSLSFFLYITFAPFGKITKFFYSFFNKIRKNILKSIAKRKKRVYNLYVRKYYIHEASLGFLADVEHKGDEYAAEEILQK